MPGLTNKTLTGYFETEYASEWPGLITNLPSSRIPPGACFSCNAQVVRGRLTPQPAIYGVTATGGLLVSLPNLAAGENVCAFANLQPPGAQQGFTVIITNFAVYIDYVLPNALATTKTFTKIFTFPTPYPRYARFGTCVIGNVLYFSSASLLGLYALKPTFSVVGFAITNPGGYFDTPPPTAFINGGGGTGPTITGVTVVGGNVTGITFSGASSGYTSAPQIVFAGGTTTGPQQGQSLASATGILSSFPLAYMVQEVSALTGVAKVQLTAVGAGYVNPQVVFTGGGGTGASATAVPDGSGGVGAIVVNSPGVGYTSPPTVTVVDAGGPGTGATGTALLFTGAPFIGGDFMSSMSSRLILDNIIGGDGNDTVSFGDILIVNGGTGYTAPTIDFVGGGGAGAAATVTLTGGVITGVTITNPGSGYVTTPAINVLDATGTGAVLVGQLGINPFRSSTSTKFPDMVAWSGPNAYGFFDPNYSIAPGGNNTIAEARGLCTSLNVIESVGFIGHNGGITEMTPNTSNALVPFSFYPLWSAEEGVLVRYGSMAQYGSTLAFLSEDSSYTMTPNGLAEIGTPIANQLENRSTWNNGNFPLQGLYGSIILIEGQKHYVISLSTDDVIFTGDTRATIVYDFNMAENSWHFWSYPGFTQTCPMFQSFDSATYQATSNAANVRIARDEWTLIPLATTVSGNDKSVVYEVAPLTRQISIGPGAVFASTLFYQFRTEAPSIARMQQERRILIEYENTPLTFSPVLNMTYTGQQDPTTQTGTISQQATTSVTLTRFTSATVPGQIVTLQADFGTFTGVCTTLSLAASGNNSLLSLVRLTQVSDLPKGQVP
jgi:hypothetical protein